MTLRADAQRNLDRLLDVAGECFAERGLDCSIDEIARRAGLGHGTVFRRFATKDELVAAVLRRQLAEVAACAAAAAEDPDPWVGFDRFVREAAAAYCANRSLIDGLEHCVGAPEQDALVAAVQTLVRRARRAGVLRPRVTAEDVLALVPTAARYPDVVLDGLRAR
jgi:AcrR family transcriptional regulator